MDEYESDIKISYIGISEVSVNDIMSCLSGKTWNISFCKQ